MIPILYPKRATKADTENGNGLGFLTDCTKCEVTEERNGVYEAVMQYPVTGELFSQITDGAIFKAAANETSEPQLFRIYKASKPINGAVTYYAEHISYALNGLPISGLKINNFSAQAAMSAALVKCPLPHEFTAYSDIITPNSVNIETPCNLRPLLGGIDGSILDVYGGEYEFDNYKINLWLHRGYDHGVVLRYGKNITDIKQESNISNCYTHLFPYAKETKTTEDGEQNEKIVTLPEQVLQLIAPADVGHSKALVYDFSNTFENGEEITEEALRQRALAYIETAQLGSPQVNITLSFASLWKTGEYKDIAALERVRLCDTVHVVFERLGIQAAAKVIKTVYDSLTEKYKSIEVGSVKANFASTVKTITQNIESAAAEAATNDAVLAARLTVEAGRITAEASRASAVEGQLASRITQTADGILSEVTRATEAEAALASTIKQEADKVSVLVSQDGKPNGAAILAAINDDGSSEVKLSADKVNFNGIVTANETFKINEDGTIEATGGRLGEFNITPNGLHSRLGWDDNWYDLEIYSEQQKEDEEWDHTEVKNFIRLLKHQDTVSSNDITYIEYGGVTVSSQWGYYNKEESIIGAGYASFTYYDGDSTNETFTEITRTTIRGGTVSAYEYKNLSDRRRKCDIATLDETPARLFDSLRPRQFRYIAGSKQLHYGFIAQEVAEELKACGLEEDALALLSPPDQQNEFYSINYIEIIALLVQETQALKARVKALEAKSED